MTAAERFGAVVDALCESPGVTPPAESRGEFGSNALKVDNRIFAMLVRGALVVKLPSRRVSDLIAAGDGEPFDAGKGRPMKEWLSVPIGSPQDWLTLSREAMEFVASKR